MGYQIGFDTGGTFTDAVLVDDMQQVLATAKALTRHENLLVGLSEALDAVVDDKAAEVTLVSLSTTLATNALVEGRGRSVGLILIGIDVARLGRARLADALGGDPAAFIDGGHDAAGAEYCPLDEAALLAFVAQHDRDVEAWAVSALFATRNATHEQRALELIRTHSAHPVSLGHSLSAGLDAPRRALTALLNARLVPLIGELLLAARELLSSRQIAAPLMVVKGDGSLIAADVAAASPVETILSGPAASLVGARFLCGDEPALMVADTGGTTTDIARLENGRPRLAPDGATVGGWRTMVRAVDIRTVALGGDGELSIDLSSKGFRLGQRRVLPLSLLAQRYPATLGVLEMQFAGQRITSHDARFAVRHRTSTPAAFARLGRAEQELLARIEDGPVDLVTLFAERSREHSLERLARAGLVLLSGFTPSDASHLGGSQSSWNRAGSELGARLLMRASAANGGPTFTSPDAFAAAARRHVAERIALALADAAVAAGRPVGKESDALSPSQRQMIESGFAGISSSDDELPAGESGGELDSMSEPTIATVPLLSVRVTLGVPLAGLGAPAATYHGVAARLLGTRALLPEHGKVANALGAVVGHVRQEARVTIVAGGGLSVRVMLEDGPVRFSSLAEGVTVATADARRKASELAFVAGVGDVTVDINREDDSVDRDGLTIFLECRITAVATGRPASG